LRGSLGNDADGLVRDLQEQFPKAHIVGGDPSYEILAAEVISYVDNPLLGFQLPLDIQGTAFQQRVWRLLGRVPAGTTVSYRDIAVAMGKPTAARAVAQACAANKIAVVIPCHRVVRTDGGISGYRWGVDRKKSLLAKEIR
jgi:AraC family transcriptional regulator of adaptative response/methylated-DNA-[protein]-cysteine methyltransferase